MVNKKVLVWDGIFKGYNHITEEEVKERKILQKKMLWQFLKSMGYGIGFGILILLLIYILIYVFE